MKEALFSSGVLNLPLWSHYIGINARRIKKAKVNYILGFCGCFLVVFVVAVMYTVLANAPLIFLRLAEINEGEMDAVIKPQYVRDGSINYNRGYQHLNFTKTLAFLSPTSTLTPRRDRSSTQVYLGSQCPTRDYRDNQWKYEHLPSDTANPVCDDATRTNNCFKRYCPGSGRQIRTIWIDSPRETEIGLGRGWTLPAIPKGKCYLHNGWATKYNVSVGEVIYLELPVSNIFGRLTNEEETIDNNLLGRNTTYITLFIPVTVDQIYGAPMGKHENSETDVMLLEYSTWIEHVSQYLPNKTSEVDRKYIRSYNIYDHADAIVINFPYPRTAAYLSSNYDTIHHNVISYVNPIFYKVGLNRISTELPILENLQVGRIISMFLGLILNIIIFVLLFLSVLLIYSLLMVNVDTMTFELGVMRMVGTQKPGIVMFLLTQAFFYAVPAWLVALILAQIALPIIAAIIDWRFGILISSVLSLPGAALASLLGIVVPIFSAILPIRSALGKNLHDSLDTRKSKTVAVKIEIERFDPTSSFSWSTVGIGLSLAVLGGSIYYSVPLALLSMNISLLLNVFFFLLVAMLLGLVMLSLNFQSILENIIVTVFLFWEKRPIRTILVKNLISHGERNKKTSIMYALSLGFIIFISVAASLQIQTIEYVKQSQAGTYNNVQARWWNGIGPRMDELVAFSSNHSKIKSFAYLTRHIQQIVPNVSDVKVTNFGRLDELPGSARVHGISPSFFKTTVKGFLSVDSALYNDDDLSAALYLEPMSALVTTSAKDFLSLELGDYFLVNLRGTRENVYSETMKSFDQQEFYIRLRVIGFINAAPCFKFSPFPLVPSQSVIVSIPTLWNMSKSAHAAVQGLPILTFLMERQDGLSTSEKAELSSDISKRFSALPELNVYDYDADASALDIPKQALELVFSFTTVVAMTVSFFSLVSSMTSNIHEQSKEIAIMRALGMSRAWMYRVYIYESFVLVMASSFLGIIIGYILGLAMTLQQSLFTQLPIPFIFPWYLLAAVLLFSMVLSVGASYFPIHRFMLMEVVKLFRLY